MVIAIRVAVAVFAGTSAPPEPFTDEFPLELPGEHIQTQAYEVLTDAGEFSFESTASSGRITVYLVPDAESKKFFGGTTFEYVAGQAFQNTQSAKGSVVLPKGTYALAFACETKEACLIQSKVAIKPTESHAALSVEPIKHKWWTPVELWNQTPVSLGAGNYLKDNEFTVDRGQLEIALSSDHAVDICVSSPTEFDNWLNSRRFSAIFCDRDTTSLSSAIPVAAGKYSLILQCVEQGSRCNATLDVVFRPDDSADPARFTFPDTLGRPLTLAPEIGASEIDPTEVEFVWLTSQSAKGEPVTMSIVANGITVCGPVVDSDRCTAKNLSWKTTYTWTVIATTNTGLRTESATAAFTTKSHQITVALAPPPSFLDPAVSKAITQIVKAAFESWNGYDGWAVHVVGENDPADVTAEYVKEWGGDRLGVAFGTGVIQIGLGDSACSETWTRFDLKSIEHVARHEMGHALGLGHTTDPNDTMYPTFATGYGEPCIWTSDTDTLTAGYFWHWNFEIDSTTNLTVLATDKAGGLIDVCIKSSSTTNCGDEGTTADYHRQISPGLYEVRIECNNSRADCVIQYSIASDPGLLVSTTRRP